MQREISDKFLPTMILVDCQLLVEQPLIITMQQKRLKKNRELISTGRYYKDIAKYIPGLLELKFQRMLEDIVIREKVAHPSCTDMEQLDFQILLTDNYHVNPNSIHICFPMKIKKKN